MTVGILKGKWEVENDVWGSPAGFGKQRRDVLMEDRAEVDLVRVLKT